jgi:ADP-ribose pyrophosphatase
MRKGKSDQQQDFEKKGVIKKNIVYRGKVFSVNQETLSKDGKEIKTWELVAHRGSVAILPINSKKELVLIRQWRPTVEKILIEVPAGTLEQGEMPLSCAKRELLEETGLKAENLTPVGGFFSTPGFCSEYIHLFLALKFESRTPSPRENEAIDVIELPLKKALEWIENQNICDAKTIVAILKYKEWHKKQK